MSESTSSDVAVTIVIPTHNRAPMLRGCLRGVLSQEAVTFEVVVVDDASTDDTAAVIAECADERVRVISHDRRRGGAASRNAGIAAARGVWVAFTDDDDLWAPSMLRAALAAGEAANAGLVYCGAVVFSDDSDTVVPSAGVPSAEFVRDNILRGNPLPGGSSAQMVQRAVLAAVGGFDVDLPILGDWDLWIRVLDATPAASVSVPLVAYRQHPGNKIVTHLGEHMAEFDRIMAKHGASARRRGMRIDGIGFYYWLANGQRRAGRNWRASGVHLKAAVKFRSPGHLVSAVRSPLGSRAVGLRSRARPELVPAPEWLRCLRAGA